ncbi:protein of unknown function (DUF4061) [Dermatophagoides pteronyssinus]|uniref:Uncharacterized protein n=2 Tax=Dermatophagoides pteronyssinus TaxID=6956 RepID=A0ABQ8JT89_DERPT|nr:integrator complex subunit 6 homolog [Dermatophagoides pteronyssinus]KAH9425516.1 protein of unknown function (DUF4061) [Dermatophagoides pteronyssinus]
MASKKKILPTSFSDDYIDIITNESNQHFRQQQQQLYHNQQQQRRSQPQILPIESYSPPPLLSTAKHPTFNRRNIHIRQQIARHSHFPSYYTLNSLYSKPNFLREFADVHETEQGLINLLTDFHEGKINAFGENITLENMIKVREQQENLARLHFEMNNQQSNKQSTIDCSSPAILIGNQTSSSSSSSTPILPSLTSSIDQHYRGYRLESQSSLANESNPISSASNVHTMMMTTTTTTTTTTPTIKTNSNSSPRIIVSMEESLQSSSSSPVSTSPQPNGSDQTIIFGKPFSKSNMIKLIQNLQNLCESIELLQSKNHNSID